MPKSLPSKSASPRLDRLLSDPEPPARPPTLARRESLRAQSYASIRIGSQVPSLAQLLR
jgi:hypothetical protein